LKKLLTILFTLLIPLSLFSQEEKERNWTLQGYAKSMQGYFRLSLPILGEQTLTDNFLHQRINFSWYPSDKWSYKMGLRTRFFFSEFARMSPDFKTNLDEGGNDVLDLTLFNIGEKVIFHSIIDRAYFQYSQNNWDVRLGRQRINWGINTFWNPNDLFNAYAFTDFDYEERPGSDALRVQYYIGYAGSIEFAIKAFDNTDEIISAFLYKFNKWEYDFQLLAGWHRQDFVLGGGWAGNIADLGFKGEFSWFNTTKSNEENVFTGTLSLDYSFSNSLYLSTGMLYNSIGNSSNNSNIFDFELSARNLYPYQWSYYISASYPITPLLSGSLALIHSPSDSHPIFLNPSIRYSLSQDVDVDVVSQLFWQENGQLGSSKIQVFYLRFKWSF